MSKVGVVGGGQLAQMLAEAGAPLGVELLCLESFLDCSASRVATVLQGDYTDKKTLQTLADQVDVLTYESENVDLAALQSLSGDTPLFPSLYALKYAQDRLLEKQLFQKLHIPTTNFLPVEHPDELEAAVAKIGLPVVVKTRRFGYDGKGQVMLREKEDMARAHQLLKGRLLLVENFIHYDREVSLIAVRGQDGQIVFYPLTENQHKQGILRVSLAPYEDQHLTDLAQKYLAALLNELDYVGVLAVEFFQQGDQLIANEMAPRVHNSGHWTIEGAITSQFENHLRAILGWPLGGADAVDYSMMINILGKMPNPEALASIPQLHIHDYAKAPRAGRKVGHMTLCGPKKQALRALGERLIAD